MQYFLKLHYDSFDPSKVYCGIHELLHRTVKLTYNIIQNISNETCLTFTFSLNCLAEHHQG